MQLVRRLARVPGDEQCTTAVSVAEIAYAAARNGDKELAGRVRDLIAAASTVLPFDHDAAETYAVLRTQLERLGAFRLRHVGETRTEGLKLGERGSKLLTSH